MRWPSQPFGRWTALRTRAALGLRPAMTPVLVFVPFGILLGPWGLGLLTSRTLSHLDLVVSATLATLGVFVGIAAGSQHRHSTRLVVASAVEGLAAFVVVALTGVYLLRSWGMQLGIDPLLCAMILGLSAAASAAPAGEHDGNEAYTIASRVADLDDVVPILLGGVALSLTTSGGDRVLGDLALTLAAGLGAGVAGWLLFDNSESAERGVFVIGTLALAGGAAAYLGTSPLIAGLATGFVWARTPGHTDRAAAADLRKVEHPFVVLLLVVAGARLDPSLAGVWLVAPYVLFRTTGKLIGAWFASRVAPGIAPSALAAYLIPPGVLGIGFILNVQQLAPTSAGPLVFAVTVGALISELVAVAVTPVPART